jgi:hypothetical protein
VTETKEVSAEYFKKMKLDDFAGSVSCKALHIPAVLRHLIEVLGVSYLKRKS